MVLRLVLLTAAAADDDNGYLDESLNLIAYYNKAAAM